VLFYDDRDRERYLRLVAREVLEREWSVLTFCLMTNHVHVLVRTPEPDLGLGLKRLHEEFARTLNARHEMHGHVFGARFYNRIIRSDRHLIGCLRYIAQNPVRHRACTRPRDWPWSAHRALAGLEPAPAFLDVASAYGHLAAKPEDARLAYLRLVAQSDQALLADLARDPNDRWLIKAVDDFTISIDVVAAFLRTSVRTAYRRLAAARDTEGSVPLVSDGREGTVP
jgi:REP element-mobilizing transposase RayT